MRDSLIETTISRDILLLTRVDKQALLRRLFELGCIYSGQIVSYNKILGQLQDAGNTTTLSHYLKLLSAAGMLTGIEKFSNQSIRTRASSPKLQVLNTALITAQSGITLNEAKQDTEFWGRLTESAVGAHLANAKAIGIGSLYYWRERNHEVDFIFKLGRKTTAIEVKSNRAPLTLPGMSEFSKAFNPSRKLLVCRSGITLEDFLSLPIEHWLK
ncbi:MAG: DUF4143 domain-containing protein [Candidatus Melainabacteria bacterium]|nr:DUF4143 domain-containing protein [Candidatus Melainabacteria bacterium]